MAETQKKRPKKLPPVLRVIGQRAGELREESGLTQTALAKKLGINPTQISRFEAGYRMLEWETTLQLCKALGAPVGYVLNGEGDRPVLQFRETDKRRRTPKGD